MENTEKALAAYALPATAIVHHTSAGFNTRAFNPPVHLMQYDKTLPVIAVSLRSGEAGELPYTVPQGAQVNVRMDKADGHHVYNPALGLDSARQTVYIGITEQMTACAGPGTAVVEVILNGGVAGAAPVALDIAENPVPEAAIRSSDEFLSIADMVAQAAASAAAAAQSASDAQGSKTAAAGSAAAAESSKTAAQSAANHAQASQTASSQSASAAQDSATAAAGSASDAAASAALAAQHANPITDAEINEAGNLILTLSSGSEVDAGYVRGPQGIQGPAGQSAYEAAVAGGYTGTLEDFQAEIAGLPGLYERFDASGRAKDALALGGVDAQTVLRGLSVPSTYTDFYEWANTQEHSGVFEIGPHMKTGVPFSDSYYSGYIEVTPSSTKRVMLTYRTGTKASYGSTFVSTYSSGEWKPWVPFAMQYDVIENPPLSNSSCVYQGAFSGETSRLCRTGNMVAGNFSIKFNAQVSAWTDILLLPAGFRPAARYTTVAVGGSNFYRAVCYHSGNLQFETSVPENTLMKFNCIWLI